MSGRLVSTTITRAPGCIRKNASAPVVKAPSYSGRPRSLESTAPAALRSRSMTIWACLPCLRAMQYSPASAPTASMSAKLWPMI